MPKIAWYGLLSVLAVLPAHTYDVKVMTFNIRYATDLADWNLRKGQVAGIIRNHAPDLVGLQEALRMQLDTLRVQLPGYGELGVGRNDGRTSGEYAAILYLRSAFTVDTSGNYWLTSTPEVAGSLYPGAGSIRINTWARFRHTATGRYVYLNNTHFDNVSAAARLFGAQLIVSRMAARAHREDPVLFMCDCNAGFNDPPLRYLRGLDGSPMALLSAYHRLYPNDPNSATFHGYNGTIAGQPIDFIMSADTVGVLSSSIIRDHVGTQYPSDHYPVMATLRINSSVPVMDRATRRIRAPRLASWPDFLRVDGRKFRN